MINYTILRVTGLKHRCGNKVLIKTDDCKKAVHIYRTIINKLRNIGSNLGWHYCFYIYEEDDITGCLNYTQLCDEEI